MLYEMRTYRTLPGRAPEFLKIYEAEGLGVITRYARLAGCWTTESGPLNSVVFLWAYDDHAHRSAQRAKLAVDAGVAGLHPEGPAAPGASGECLPDSGGVLREALNPRRRPTAPLPGRPLDCIAPGGTISPFSRTIRRAMVRAAAGAPSGNRSTAPTAQ